MDSYSIRFASGRISPNLDPQVVDCWLDTTGELNRAQRPGRYKARDALSMPRGPGLLRAHCIPDQPTALRHDARKLGRAGLASDDSEGHTIELVELDCGGCQWTLPYNLGPGDADDRLYEIKPATAFIMVTLCLYQPPRST